MPFEPVCECWDTLVLASYCAELLHESDAAQIPHSLASELRAVEETDQSKTGFISP